HASLRAPWTSGSLSLLLTCHPKTPQRWSMRGASLSFAPEPAISRARSCSIWHEPCLPSPTRSVSSILSFPDIEDDPVRNADIGSAAVAMQDDLFGKKDDLPEGFRYHANLIANDEESELVRQLKALAFQPFDFHG